MKRVYTRCSETVAEVMADMWQQALSEEILRSLEREVEEFKKVLVEIFDEQFTLVCIV